MESALTLFVFLCLYTVGSYIAIFGVWYRNLDVSKKASKAYWKKIDKRLSYAGAFLLFLSFTGLTTAIRQEAKVEESILHAANRQVQLTGFSIRHHYCYGGTVMAPKTCSALEGMNVALNTGLNPRGPLYFAAPAIKAEISSTDWDRLERDISAYEQQQAKSAKSFLPEDSALWPLFLTLVTIYANIVAAFRIAKSKAECEIEDAAEEKAAAIKESAQYRHYEVEPFKQRYALDDVMLEELVNSKVVQDNGVKRLRVITIPPQSAAWFTDRLAELEASYSRRA